LNHDASTQSDVLTVVVSKASIPQASYALSLCRHFESSRGS